MRVLGAVVRALEPRGAVHWPPLILDWLGWSCGSGVREAQRATLSGAGGIHSVVTGIR
ncbi:hypothetical protein [Nocardiopsis sp. YSL2]|uniref:hypothetical protein n=1 Tax=Nocardiopsis sp. YSL2 TaxID=2939492 RepID=UPI0026F46057|nr:hypothetical protein [Nocardiopsis sp. YSL2]